ncbi:MAG: dTDP-4-dehydrorhamnose reductase, partial [Parcubacteria group bacterium]
SLGDQLVKVFTENKKIEVIPWDKEEIDITDQGLLAKKIKEIKPVIIINAAAFSAVDKCEEAEGNQLAMKINGQAPGFLAQAALAVGAILIHYSSDYVFNGKKRQGYTEEDEPKPISKYGESKLAGEQEIIRLSGRGLKWYLIRTSKLFGPKGLSEAAKPSFFDTMLKLSETRDAFDLVNEETSCFTYTPDLAEATRKLIDENRGFGIYHIVNPRPATWYEAAKKLFELADKKVKLTPVPASKFPRPARRPKYSVLINTKLEPLGPWQAALEKYLKTRNQAV